MTNAFDLSLTRRRILQTAILSVAAAGLPASSFAQTSSQRFEQWVVDFRPRAVARGISGATYDSVMNGLKPDMAVFALQSAQPEFNEQLWQYLNRRVSEWRIVTGRERAREYAPLFNKLEQDFGVSRGILLGLWGMETAYGDPIVHQNHMRPVVSMPRCAGLGRTASPQILGNRTDQRLADRRARLEQSARDARLLAGAMGHTQWMPEVWLNIGADYDGDGRANPFGKPNDALAGTCRYLLQRGGYQQRRALGLRGARASPRAVPVLMPIGKRPASCAPTASPIRCRMQKPKAGCRSRAAPSFLIGANFNAVKS